MKRTYDTSRFALALGLTLASGLVSAAPVELITNGGFETGNFTGWTATSQTGSLGALFIDNADGLTPDSGHPTVGSATGLFYAVTDQLGGGAYSLEQSFTVALGTTTRFRLILHKPHCRHISSGKFSRGASNDQVCCPAHR